MHILLREHCQHSTNYKIKSTFHLETLEFFFYFKFNFKSTNFFFKGRFNYFFFNLFNYLK